MDALTKKLFYSECNKLALNRALGPYFFGFRLNQFKINTAQETYYEPNFFYRKRQSCYY